MIGRVRHNPSTVVVLAGQPREQVLAAVGRSLNVVLVRPELPRGAGVRRTAMAEAAGIEAAAAALRRAAGVSAPYVLVAADPLAGVAAAWQAMWSLTAESHGSDEFELRAAEAHGRLAGEALRNARLLPGSRRGDRVRARPARRQLGGGHEAGAAGELRADFYLGPLRAVRPNRVAVAAGASPAAQADALLSELGSLRHGPWWPPLDEILRTARGFYPGSLAESPTAGQASLLS